MLEWHYLKLCDSDEFQKALKALDLPGRAYLISQWRDFKIKDGVFNHFLVGNIKPNNVFVLFSDCLHFS